MDTGARWNIRQRSGQRACQGSALSENPCDYSGEHIPRCAASHTVLHHRSPPGPMSCGRAATTPTPENWNFERGASPPSPPVHGGTGSQTVGTGRPKLLSLPEA
ncbi:hypothetical protein HPB51_019249 [Rhipicephalus microplus]|uniref:Uncharacterized protein n=1 Tax=Rhipicephalus microplus TaxID=6941 RepID=A0A9J6F5P3_RHIMP|nr:hypothetical protein HPB51_019249 [Rhipicephalus microplus]